MNNLTTKQLDLAISSDGATDNKALAANELWQQVYEIISTAPVFDLHTHLYAPQFGELNLFGIDELLNYHYLIAELFRFSTLTPEEFWRLEKTKQSDLIWQTLFVENTPLSEATRGVIAVLSTLGLNTRAEDLREAREFFAAQKPEDYLEKVLKISRVNDIVMTNDPLDESEIKVWNGDKKIDSRFHAALRLDRLLNGWAETVPLMNKQNYDVSANLDERAIQETRRFLDDWISKMKPLYLGVSLPDDFVYPEKSARGKLINEAILPTCKAHGISLALMIGVRRRVNPALKLAGDGLGRADVSVVSRICAENPDVKFLVTFLSRENQHELCVVARKFANLMPFGCWWFLNNASIISEITRERFELLGTSFIPQHSDARILDQLIYKWNHSRRLIADALFESYQGLLEDGRIVTKKEIQRDAEKLFSGNFRNWVGLE
ncbi:MAG: glucuronate isomerase [Acidobacteria bacterium]|nr:glucuronate isomerase [Acidobacteriota bacterium]MCA1639101.1 glucuronate isomerase [Acidobacteriota bacterium]